MPSKPAPALAETDLYGPVRDYLEAQGYLVQGEVRQCDVAAVRGEELLVVELKLRLGHEVLAQAARRREIADVVYVAIPKPPRIAEWRKRSVGLLYLLRRLEIGLLLVSPRARTAPRVAVEAPVAIFDPVRNGALRSAVLREVRRRSGDFNPGGSVRRKLVGAHRETAIHIACCLERHGPLRVTDLHRLGTGLSTRSVLEASARIECWFRRLPDERWSLRPRGKRALEEHPEAAAHFRALVSQARVLPSSSDAER